MSDDKGHELCIVHIISTAYSGSTWVNLVLGSHPQTFSVGELKQSLRPGGGECSLHGANCPVFSQFDPHSGESPFMQLQRLSRKRILVVNNSRKFLAAQFEPGINSRFIHLMRDGRPVTASFLRKGRYPNIWRAARRWVHEIRRNRRLLRRLAPAPVCSLHYEALVANPGDQLKRLCHFIGIEPNEQMLRYWEQEHHFLGGNRGTLLAMMRKSDPAVELPPPPSTSATGRDENLSWYAQTDSARFFDERWKSERSAGQLRLFQIIAGRTNRALGYTKLAAQSTRGRNNTREP